MNYSFTLVTGSFSYSVYLLHFQNFFFLFYLSSKYILLRSHKNKKVFTFGGRVASCPPRTLPAGTEWPPRPGFSLGLGREANQAWGRAFQGILSKNIGSSVHDPLFLNHTSKLSLQYQNLWYCPVTQYFFFLQKNKSLIR